MNYPPTSLPVNHTAAAVGLPVILYQYFVLVNMIAHAIITEIGKNDEF